MNDWIHLDTTSVSDRPSTMLVDAADHAAPKAECPISAGQRFTRWRPLIGFLTGMMTNGLVRLFANAVPHDLREWYISTQLGEADALGRQGKYLAQIRYVLDLRRGASGWSEQAEGHVDDLGEE